jgi:hypothetical protein
MKKKFAMSWMVVFVLLTVPLLSMGQEGSGADRAYGRGKVILKDSTRYDALNLKFTSESLSFTDKKTSQPLTFPLAEVDFVSRTRNHALEGALFGGGLMLVSCLTAVLQVESDPNLEFKENAGLIILGFTAGGTALGALIGSAFSSDKTVFQKGRLVVNLGVPLTFHGYPGGLGLSLVRLQVRF